MWRIVLPCITQGLIVGLVMNFTLAISDFVYANLLVGGHFPTLQIFMGVLNGGSGRKLSVLITTYFIVIFVVTAIVVWVDVTEKRRMSYVEILALTKRFGETMVFEDIDLDVEQGTICVLVGPSGCGKTTLLRAVAGLTRLTMARSPSTAGMSPLLRPSIAGSAWCSSIMRCFPI